MEDEQQINYSDGSENLLTDWTKDEKYDLLLALKAYGSYNLEKLCEAVPTKSQEKVVNAINYYKKKALKDRTVKKTAKTTVDNIPRIPLASWAKFITDSSNFKELHTETAAALRLIAEFEDIPPAVCTENIDFKNIYHLIANALEGKALPDNKMIAMILSKCIIETALTSKAFSKISSYRHLLETISMPDKIVNYFPKVTDDNELATLRHLAAQKTYNPLNIPENFLRPAVNEDP